MVNNANAQAVGKHLAKIAGETASLREALRKTQQQLVMTTQGGQGNFGSASPFVPYQQPTPPPLAYQQPPPPPPVYQYPAAANAAIPPPPQVPLPMAATGL